MKEGRGTLHSSHCILGALVVLLLVACGGGGGGTSDGTDTTGAAPGKVVIEGHEFSPAFFVDGEDNNISVTYFNDDGSIASRHDLYEWEGDTLTYAEEWTYHYDAGGRVTSVDYEDTYTRDASGGYYYHIFSTIVYEYDASGNVATETEWLTAEDDFGTYTYHDIGDVVRSITTHTYDGASRRTQTDVDWGGDGIANSSTDKTVTFTYDASDRIIEEHTVANGGVTDYTVTYTYDADSRVETSIRSGYSSYDETTTYTYDAAGAIQTEEEVVITPDRSEKITRDYLHETRDPDSDGTPEASVAYHVWLGPVYDYGGGYLEDTPPSWFTDAESNLNDGDDSDGWGLDWSGHATGTCTTCGNMVGQVNTILLGF